MSGEDAQLLGRLNELQLAMLPLLAEGLTNQEIAARLYVSPHTVRTYLFEIGRKFGLPHPVRRTAILAYWIQHKEI